jgi:transposase
MPYISGVDRYQPTMLPEVVDDYIAEDNPVRVIDAYVDQVDMVAHNFSFSICPKLGRPPYDPRTMLKLYLYGYLNRIRSSRRLEDEAKRNLELIWLLEKLAPDFKTIADFRKNNKKALKELFKDFSRLCKDWGLYGKETVAIDGTKFKASNSKKKNYSKKKLDRHIKYLEEKIDRYFDELDENDQFEKADVKLSKKEIEEKIEELKKRKNRYETMKKELEETGEHEISTTDSDARLMSNNNGSVEVAYNVQTAVDSKHKLIITFDVLNQANDLGCLSPLALEVKQFLECETLEMLADKGYYQTDCLKTCVENGIRPFVSKQAHANRTGNKNYYPERFTYDKEKDLYICPAGAELAYSRTRRSNEKGILGYDYRNSKACKNCIEKPQCTKNKNGRTIFRNVNQDFLDTVDLKTKADFEKYKQRQMIVEHPFGTIKHIWAAGYFLTRRIENVTAEVSLSYLAYNLKRTISILGVEEMVERLKERRKPALA